MKQKEIFAGMIVLLFVSSIACNVVSLSKDIVPIGERAMFYIRNGGPVYLLEWNRTWGGVLGDGGEGIAVDNDNNVYIVGYAHSFGDTAFLAKYNRTGHQLWNRTWAESNWGSFRDIALDYQGNFYVASSHLVVKLNGTGHPLWNDTGPSEVNSLAVDNESNVFIAGYDFSGPYVTAYLRKYNSTGHYQWNVTLSDNEDMRGEGVAVDQNNSIYIAVRGIGKNYILKLNQSGAQIWNLTIKGFICYGITIDTYYNIYLSGDISSATSDAFLAKFNATGYQLWNATWAGPDQEHCEMVHHIAIDRYNNSYVTGYTSSYGAGGLDAFLVKFDAAGSIAWYRTWGGPWTDAGRGVALDAIGNLYLAGQMDVTEFNYDAFLVKYGVDTDNDTLTDDVETYRHGTNASNPDTDADQIPDGIELQLLLDPVNGSDALADFDGDSLINLDEYTNGTDLRDPDSDEDGLLDGAEVHVYGTDPLDPDTDGDGYSDGAEIAAGTDPLDPESHPSGGTPAWALMVTLAVAAAVAVVVVAFIIRRARARRG